jgi:sterol desaturase/sphingolipid hydroxylase (fatty acid hydroxylase superfamily)
MSPLVVALINLVVLAAIFVPLERVFPARVGQPIARPALALDGCFFFGQYLLTSAASLALLGLVAGALHDHGAWLRFASRLPAWLQVVIAVMLGDFVVYWFHRACHRFDVLWRFHAVHHSAEHLDWVAAHREHPLDGIATQLCMNLPAMMLGVHMELLAGVAVFRGMWAIFVHSNVKVPLGPLRWIFGAPELHHWHHARLESGQRTHNFANLAPYLDVVFGTHHCPEGDETYALGLEPRARMKPSWAHMMLRPFLPASYFTTQTLPVPQPADLPVHGLTKHSDGLVQVGPLSPGPSAMHSHLPSH